MPDKLDKTELEKQKLQAEIKAIEFKIASDKDKIEAEQKHAFRENMRSWATVVLGIVTLLSVGFTLGTQFYTYLEQRAKQYDFEINNQMIELVKQLNSNDQAQQENAALLLSTFEKDAIPILLKNLERSNINQRQATIESLHLIEKKKKVTENDIFEPLYYKTERVFRQEAVKTEETMNVISILNLIVALREFGEINKTKTLNLLESLKIRLQKKQPSLSEATMDAITIQMNATIEKLSQEPNQNNS